MFYRALCVMLAVVLTLTEAAPMWEEREEDGFTDPRSDGIVAYSMPQGERRGSRVDLYDFTYNGTVKDGYLSGGIGQLSDREVGHTNFRRDPENKGHKGYEWVGWRNESFLGKPVEIVCKFDTVRNFSMVKIHANNYFSKDVRVFRMARLYFSIGGKHFLSQPVEFRYIRDQLIEYARPVIIQSHHKIGQYVKIQLYFDSNWMMISEVEFTSTIANGTFTPEVLPSQPTSKPDDSNIKVNEVNPVLKMNSSFTTDGSVAYSMPQGERRGSGVDLYDLTYDGTVKDGYLSGGIGQLSDREVGHTNFRLDPQNKGHKGYEWVGWRNKTFLGKPVEIVYKFDTVRNFSVVKIHANNYFSKDVRVFRMARLYFSIGGKYFLSQNVEFRYMRDKLLEYARPVIIQCHHKIGQYVKIQLYFDSKWMMISEVEFTSTIANGTFTLEVLPSQPTSMPDDSNIKVIEGNPVLKLNSSFTTDGIVAYSMPQGERRGSRVDLNDLTYDGTVKDGYLSGGIGQLSDREVGHTNFRLDPQNKGHKGYEWVGWRNKTFLGKPVEIVYKFDTVRNFSMVKIHANNYFSKDVRVFRMARLYFSIGGKHFLSQPVEFRYMRDYLIEYARPVIMQSHHKIGQYVKIQLYFDSKWMMISEVDFTSTIANGTFTPEVLPSQPKSKPDDSNIN